MSCAVIITSTAWRKARTSNSPRSSRNLSRLMDARLQAELSRCMYSLHGLEALMRPELGQVCQSLIVVSNCIPGSPQACAASAIIRIRSRALYVPSALWSLTKWVVPFAVLGHRAHELVGRAHRVVGVLKEHRAVGRTVERGVVAGVDQRPRLALLLLLALDEKFDVGMVGVEHHHLGRAPGLAARLDHARRGVGRLHEAERARGGAAGRELLAARTHSRKIDPRPGAAFKDDSLVAVPVQDRVHVVVDLQDEAGRALRLGLDTDVEVHGAVEGRALGHQQRG